MGGLWFFPPPLPLVQIEGVLGVPINGKQPGQIKSSTWDEEKKQNMQNFIENCHPSFKFSLLKDYNCFVSDDLIFPESTIY